MEPQKVEEMLAGVVSKLTWCFAHKHHFLNDSAMTQSIGSHAPLCGPSNADKIN
jgi:hypothetical protein